MTASNRDFCIDKVLAHEGGCSNHPSDPGGPTNFGITLADARAYWKPKATAADIQAMPRRVAVSIYEVMYWDVQRCDELPAGVDYTVFDYGVNSGVRRAKKVLQRTVGVADDGELGPVTMQAIAAHDPQAIIVAMNDERLRFLKSLKTWPVFGKGWQRRVSDVRALSLALAARASSPADVFSQEVLSQDVTPPPPAFGKGTVPQPHVLRSAVKGGGSGAAIAAIAASQAAIASHPGTAAMIIAGFVAAAAVAVWLIAQHHRKKQEAPPAASSASAA